MRTVRTIGITVTVAVATWLALNLAVSALGFMTGMAGFCPQAPDWWITTYSVTAFSVFWVVAPAAAIIVAWLVLRRRRRRA